MSERPPDPPTRLARRLGLFDAVVIGLGAMIGAGVFAALGPAAAAAGSGLLVGSAIAAVVAYCNATSSAALAAVYPESGGTYVYGRERLGPFWGTWPAGGSSSARPPAARRWRSPSAPTPRREATPGSPSRPSSCSPRSTTAACSKTARLTRVIVAVVLGVARGRRGRCARRRAGVAPTTSARSPTAAWRGILEAAGLLFFAFAGYARIATLGEEVVDPARTIPRAIPLALGITARRLRDRRGVARCWPSAQRPWPPRRRRSPPRCEAGDLDGLVPGRAGRRRRRRRSACCCR